MISLTPLEYRIHRMLQNRSTSVPAKELAKVISSKNKVATTVNTMRLKGIPICTNSKGFYLAKTKAEVTEFLSQTLKQIADQEKSIQRMREIYEAVNSNIVLANNIAKVTFTRAVRKGDSVVYVDFPVDENGNVVIPAGTQLV